MVDYNLNDKFSTFLHFVREGYSFPFKQKSAADSALQVHWQD
jgi:hypothetical protein